MKTDNLKYFSLMMALGATTSQHNYYENEYKKTNSMLATRRKSTIKNMSEEQKAIKSGLKKFEYHNGFVFALNQKNADKKAKKQGLI